MHNPLKSVGIAGGGLMGCSIAAAFLRTGIPVLLYDFAEGALRTAPERITEELACQFARSLNADETDRNEAAKRVASSLNVTGTLAEMDSCDVILETIVEKSKVKQKFYRTLDEICTAPKLLLSNTSTIRITELAGGLEKTHFLNPARFCGFHFFHPVRKRSLVEIIRGAATDPETLEEASSLAHQIEKEPILVSDGPGFLVNRVLNPYLEEAMTLLLEGIPLEQIENTCRQFGMEMGPFRIMDEIGLDVTFHSGWTFYKAFPEYIRSGELLPAMIESGRLGRKNGRGFKTYKLKGNWSDDGIEDPELLPLIQKVSTLQQEPRLVSSSEFPLGEGRKLNGAEIDEEILTLRIFCAILTEGRRAVLEGIVSHTAEVDRALTRGLGFPREKGGIFPWAESYGQQKIEQICNELKKLNPKYEIVPLR